MQRNEEVGGMVCQGNFGPEKYGPGDQYSIKKNWSPRTEIFVEFQSLSWNLGPPCQKICTLLNLS